MEVGETWKCPACGEDNPHDGRFCGGCGLQKLHEPSRVGEVALGRYRIVDTIDRGATGTVYRAEQRVGTVLRPVAVKVLRAQASPDPETRARFHRECEALVKLEHPNTVRVYDFGELADGSLAIVMELVNGRSLLRVLAEEGPLEAARVFRIARQIAGSLEEAHARGIIHRDLKPGNVMLVEYGGAEDVAKVCDFGLARQVGVIPLTAPGMVLGTPQYMSPEQAAGEKVDGRADVYSLAVVVYEMLTGYLPFPNARSLGEWLLAHRSLPPTPIEAHAGGAALSARARASLMQALDKSPSRRPATPLALVDALTSQDPPEAPREPAKEGFADTVPLPAFTPPRGRPVADATEPRRGVAAARPPQPGFTPPRAPRSRRPPDPDRSLGWRILWLTLLAGAAVSTGLIVAMLVVGASGDVQPGKEVAANPQHKTATARLH